MGGGFAAHEELLHINSLLRRFCGVAKVKRTPRLVDGEVTRLKAEG